MAPTLMRHRRLAVGAGLGALTLAAACSQILDVEDIPTRSPDAGVDATKPLDAGHDAHGDAPVDARFDAGIDAFVACEAGVTRCSATGPGVERCGDKGVWSAAKACPSDLPVCIAGACACEPGSTRCAGQSFQRCVVPDAGAPSWPDGGVSCPGTCTITGCGAVPPSCGHLDGGALDGALPVAAGAGVTDCPSREGGVESCCASNETPGGTFYRSYDGEQYPLEAANEATVSPFRLDRFEVTVGRFRRFVASVAGPTAWTPPPGSGKHAHLNGGQGLVTETFDGGATYETGWNPAWKDELLASIAAIDVNSGPSCTPYSTWTPYLGAHEGLPMNCLTWVEAYAFCIWDSGFLPSEAEWDFAAAGGAEQRVYPWSPSLEDEPTLDAGATIDCNEANYEGTKPAAACVRKPIKVGALPGGDSKWLQADMSGNVDEWTADVFGAYLPSCTDCARPPTGDAAAPIRVRRGGAFLSLAPEVAASYRGYYAQNESLYTGGVRCARTP